MVATAPVARQPTAQRLNLMLLRCHVYTLRGGAVVTVAIQKSPEDPDIARYVRLQDGSDLSFKPNNCRCILGATFRCFLQQGTWARFENVTHATRRRSAGDVPAIQ